MSTRKQRQSTRKKQKKDQRKKSSSGDIPPQKKGDDVTALKSMGIGAAVFAVVAIVFFLKIGGDTPFNHAVKLFSPAPAPVTAPKDGAAKPGSSRSAKAIPKVAANAGSAPAADKHTRREQESLDDLVEARTK